MGRYFNTLNFRDKVFNLGTNVSKKGNGRDDKSHKILHNELNKKSYIPILLNLDVDHGDIKSKNKDDYNPYN